MLIRSFLKHLKFVFRVTHAFEIFIYNEKERDYNFCYQKS